MPNITCTTSTFPIPSLPNATILSLTATLIQNYTINTTPFLVPNHGPIQPTTLDFCNITIHHAHDSHNESIETQIWLPASTWNGRTQGIGGGGYIAGLYSYMFTAMDGAMAEGYATYSTNAGIYNTDINGGDADTWFLADPANPNYHQLEDFAYRSLGDMTDLANQVVKSYYGRKQEYSYFSGCSNGGRQATQLAYRWPEEYDGIAACAPGLYWEQQIETIWGHLTMVQEGHAPFPCELDALRGFMMETCDGIDGVEDEILQDPEACDFDPWSVRGRRIGCGDALNGTVEISEVAVKIADGVWRDKKPEGVDYQMHTTGYDSTLHVSGEVSCSNGMCVPNADAFTRNWLKNFVIKDPTWRPGNITASEVESLRQRSIEEYHDIIGTNPDLSAFAKHGGKMITYHGTSDQAVAYKNTLRFYEAVQSAVPSTDIRDYFRVFLAPGLGHGIGGKGAYPHTTFHALVDWVENGKAPDTLAASSLPDEDTPLIHRVLCAWPTKSVYTGGNPNEAESWTCA